MIDVILLSKMVTVPSGCRSLFHLNEYLLPLSIPPVACGSCIRGIDTYLFWFPSSLSVGSKDVVLYQKSPIVDSAAVGSVSCSQVVYPPPPDPPPLRIVW